MTVSHEPIHPTRTTADPREDEQAGHVEQVLECQHHRHADHCRHHNALAALEHQPSPGTADPSIRAKAMPLKGWVETARSVSAYRSAKMELNLLSHAQVASLAARGRGQFLGQFHQGIWPRRVGMESSDPQEDRQVPQKDGRARPAVARHFISSVVDGAAMTM
ncbi:hypothetical protein BDW42DRAFT_7435 [Aspergillus taichungensis]|uniref:Uncharacterized protein n=1 Tax=Aspergillus taichungensis TaxID=482145 RepID=A0A2J5HJC1_9EURO|nr:hypothetical protein BDW42DRAFT_7435 [Aspergillus taichungensis]